MDFWTAAAYWAIVGLVLLNAWLVRRMDVVVHDEVVSMLGFHLQFGQDLIQGGISFRNDDGTVAGRTVKHC